MNVRALDIVDGSAAGSPTDVSVIVPAANAGGTLDRTLRALARSDFRGRVEIIVVDDASQDDTANIAKCRNARVVRLASQTGPAGARNAGVASSSAAKIAFTDSDCEPSPGWLQAMVDGLNAADLVMGPVLPDAAVTPRRFDRTLNIVEPSPRFETANLGVRRSLFDAVGGFEPFVARDGAEPGCRPKIGQGHIGEDIVFGWRAHRLGARIDFRPEAVVFHAVFPRGPRGYIAEKWRLRFFPALVREVPELRRSLALRVFLSDRTLRFDLAVAGTLAALVVRQPWPLLTWVLYGRGCLRTTGLWRRSAARENLALVTGDAVALMALIRGSLAARRLLL